MSSINGETYWNKFQDNHAQAAAVYNAIKIYRYKSLQSSNLSIAYKIINSVEEENDFLKSEYVFEPELLWQKIRE